MFFCSSGNKRAHWYVYTLSYQWSHSIDIRGVNYFSDEKALNATIWLNSPFNKTVVDYLDTVSYGMYIDSDSSKEPG